MKERTGMFSSSFFEGIFQSYYTLALRKSGKSLINPSPDTVLRNSIQSSTTTLLPNGNDLFKRFFDDLDY